MQQLNEVNGSMEILISDRQGWLTRAKLLESLGKHHAALGCYERIMDDKPDYQRIRNIIKIMSDLLLCLEAADSCFNRALKKYHGDREEKVILEHFAIPGKSIASCCYNRACFEALQGNIAPAVAYLEQAIQLQGDKYCHISQQDPDFDRIRETKLFQDVVNKPAIK